MRYQIVHTTTYTYDRSVVLNPHIIRLRSRCDGTQKLLSFFLEIDPEPIGISHITDLDGNAILQTWFGGSTDYLKIEVRSEVETYRTNPFDYLLEPWALSLPIDYPASMLSQLQPYLQPQYQINADPAVIQLAQDIGFAADYQIATFLMQLNQRIYENCQYIRRETGEALPGGVTWNQKLGSCRDLAVLFMEVCRAVGLAARFVSGYQQGDPDQQKRDLHAWAEVYLPGAGWRGYDPSQGLAVADSYIALAASALPIYAAPITGGWQGTGVRSQIKTHLSLITND
ncbi:transglutaminase family protein [Argonema antarcticum]|uniref:transglutaminase family protein n=1 Tax=Argonema antarcticum TaxID=2942763 RepID=UPI002012C27A|nr:transglutaminase family protein [Argonema antarcticum]MCL1473836.1 transglutaminase family protein [Argonema antarcticum A004/B2]